MRSKKQKPTARFLTVIFVLAVLSSQFALAGEYPISALSDKNHITFAGLSDLAADDYIEYEIIDSDGNPAVVGIRRATSPVNIHSTARSGGETWQVWYTGITINAKFYMTVSGNKVTSVYDDTITIVGGTYDNALLTRTSTYGKLSFKVTSVGNLLSKSCWLKGTVTGTDDQIEVTWQM